MKLTFITSIFIGCLFIFASISFSADLHWSPVESTQDCVIEGYKVYYGPISQRYANVIDVGNLTAYNLDLLDLVPDLTYYFEVSAYSTASLEGPSSDFVSYIERPNIAPNIVAYPSIDHINNTIDISFNETDMQGADIKTNYEFSPTILFDDARDIVRTELTYRLFLDYIPQRTIISMTLNHVTDGEGLALANDSIVINDDDKDGMADDWESYYGITTSFSDPDSDGLYNSQEYATGTSPVNNDSDNDGMDDGWEVQNSLNPLLDDADGDIDANGISNLDEYNRETGVSNPGPEKPVLHLPNNFSENVQLSPRFQTMPYLNPENDAHAKTQWQISTEETFTTPENILFELETYDALTGLTAHELILDPDTTYFWRVRFFDVLDNGSAWSDPFSFTSMPVNPEDADGNGVPDIQQVTDGTIDLNDDGSLDISSTTYKMVTNGIVSYGLEASTNVTSIDHLKLIDPDDISDTFGRPDDLNFGLIQFKISVANPGDTAEVRVHVSEPVGTNWYKHDLVNGWTEYSMDYPDNVQFASDRKTVVLSLVDGGPGDSDGVANGLIVDPSGPGGFPATPLPDTNAPEVRITFPASGGSHDTESNSLDIAGTASDEQGVARIEWSSSNGGSGTAVGTENWSVTGIFLAQGENVITITAYDAAGNASTDTLIIMYTIPDTNDWTELSNDDFESGWGSFQDGGKDARRDPRYAHQGRYSIKIRDNSGTSSSFWHTNGMDVLTPDYSQIKIEFWYYPQSMEDNEDFWVQYFDGKTWITVGLYRAGKEFNNGSFYHEQGILINKGAVNFSETMRIRFMCDASDDKDMIYIDEVVVSAR